MWTQRNALTEPFVTGGGFGGIRFTCCRFTNSLRRPLTPATESRVGEAARLIFLNNKSRAVSLISMFVYENERQRRRNATDLQTTP